MQYLNDGFHTGTFSYQESQRAEEVPAQTIPHIHLLPANTGLKVSLLSRPFAQGGPYYRPGTGGETVITEIEGKRLQTRIILLCHCDVRS